MLEQFARTSLLLGEKPLEKLEKSRVAIFGLGGVGGYVLEALARCGVGSIDIIDNDKFATSNINRQILATFETIGLNKVDVAEKRIKSINPEIKVYKHQFFYLPNLQNDLEWDKFDYVIDAIDTIAAKLDIIDKCMQMKIPLISCMGCGNRIDPSKLRIADIYETSYDPLSKVIRRECRKRGITSLKVCYSKEEALRPLKPITDSSLDLIESKARRKDIPGSISFVPSVAGLLIAAEVFKDITKFDRNKREISSDKREKE